MILLRKILKNHQQKFWLWHRFRYWFWNSGYDIAINPVNQAPPTDDADENGSVWTLLVLNESGNFDFQVDGSECGTKHISNAKAPKDFFYLMFKPI